MKTSHPEEVSAVEAARTLRIALDYTYRLIWAGKLAARKVGKRWRIPVEAINERLKAVER